ncbi:hypothetical protein BH11MYX1_BH11MYX1_29520 [soil metagenome]
MRWWLAAVPLLFAVTSYGAPRQSNPAFLGIGFANGPALRPPLIGCIVDTVTPVGPAADAGIEVGDSVLAFDGLTLDAKLPCDQLVANITMHAPGDKVRVDLDRSGRHVDTVATLATRADMVQRRVGKRIGTTDLVDADDPRRHYDLGERVGKTYVVGWFTERCTGCARVFDRIADGLKARASSAFELAVTPRDTLDDMSAVRKSFASPVALAVADNATFGSLAMEDPERAFFMVIDCRGIIRLVTPIAPDSDDLEAAIDEVLAGATQAEHTRTARR